MARGGSAGENLLMDTLAGVSPCSCLDYLQRARFSPPTSFLCNIAWLLCVHLGRDGCFSSQGVGGGMDGWVGGGREDRA